MPLSNPPVCVPPARQLPVMSGDLMLARQGLLMRPCELRDAHRDALIF
jgi:hypothetical protein